MRRARLVALALGGLVLASVAGSDAAGDADDLTGALGRLGPPGLLWGRLAVEEESPDGPWTPLVGVEVVVYPYLPDVLAELERVRLSARASSRQFDTAIARFQDVLRAHKAQVEAAAARLGPGAGEPGAASAPGAEFVRRQVTGNAGVFTFADLPSGEWLAVAIRVTPYAAPSGQAPRRSAGRESRFVQTPGRGPARAAEVWVARVRVGPGQQSRLLLTDRGHWLVGPLR